MIKSAFLALITTAATLGAGSAHAGGVSWSIGINTPVVGTVISNAPGYARGYRTVYAQEPVYESVPVYAQEPVYESVPVYAPAPIYRAVPRVTYYPAPIYYRQAPTYDNYRPAPVAYPRYYPGWRHGGWRGHDRDHDREHDRGDDHH